MEESKKADRELSRPRRERSRDHPNDRPKKRNDYAAGADGEQDVKAGPSDEDDLFRPDRDGSGW